MSRSPYFYRPEPDVPLPEWLSVPDAKLPRPKGDAKAVLHLEYEQLFERIIEQLCRGRTLQSLVDEDPRDISYEDFLRWIKRDAQRNERYKEAQESRTEFMAGEILQISDGMDTIDPQSSDSVSRDKLRIETRKFLMSAWNKRRYGEVKQVEVGGSISITDALVQARARLIEGEVITIEDMDNAPVLELEREYNHECGN